MLLLLLLLSLVLVVVAVAVAAVAAAVVLLPPQSPPRLRPRPDVPPRTQTAVWRRAVPSPPLTPGLWSDGPEPPPAAAGSTGGAPWPPDGHAAGANGGANGGGFPFHLHAREASASSLGQLFASCELPLPFEAHQAPAPGRLPPRPPSPARPLFKWLLRALVLVEAYGWLKVGPRRHTQCSSHGCDSGRGKRRRGHGGRAPNRLLPLCPHSPGRRRCGTRRSR